MTTENTVIKTIADNFDSGMGRDEIIIAVFQEHADIGLNKANALVAKWYKDNGHAVTKQGINAAFDEWLLSADPAKPRTAADVSKYIKDEGTPNMERHKTHYQRIAALAAAAFKKGLES